MSTSTRERMRDHRRGLREQGLRPIQIWVPDIHSPRFAEQAHLQSLAVATSSLAEEDQAFIDAVSDPVAEPIPEVVREPPAGFGHGVHAARIGSVLQAWAERHEAGVVCAAETGFVLFRDPDTVRAPDAAFVSEERLAQVADREPFFEGAPDLAVEVVSPGDRAPEVAAKVRDYLGAGSRQVWIIRPRERTLTVHRPGAAPRHLGADTTLEGGDVLPGFSLRVARIFGE